MIKQQKNKNHSRSKRPPYLYILLPIFLVATLASILIFTEKLTITNPPAPIKNTHPHISTQSSSSSDHQSSIDPVKKTPQKNDPSSTPPPENLITGSITHSSVSEGKLILRFNFDQLLSEAGTCRLVLTHVKTSKQVIYSAPTFNNPSSSTCQGFDLSVTELSSGEWSLQAFVQSGSKQGIVNGKVTI